MSVYTEDTLVQQTTAEYLEQELGWQSVRPRVFRAEQPLSAIICKVKGRYEY